MMPHRTLTILAAAALSTVALARSADAQTQTAPSTTVANEVIAGRYAAAVLAADSALPRDPNNPWLHYNRAVALGHLQRTDEAAATFDRAAALFDEQQNAWGRSIALYGKARAYDEVNRCADASRAYDAYASVVRPTDAAAAEDAVKFAKACTLPAVPTGPVATTPEPTQRAIGGGPRPRSTKPRAKHK